MSIKTLIDGIRLRAEEAGAKLPMSRARDLTAHLLFGRSYSAGIAAERDGRLPNPELTAFRTARLRKEYGRPVDLIANIAAAVLGENPSTLGGARSRGPSWMANLNEVAMHKLMRSAAEVEHEIVFSRIAAKTFDEKKQLWLFRLEDEWYAEVLRFGQEAEASNVDISRSCFVHYINVKDGKYSATVQVCALQDEHPRCTDVGPASTVKSKSEQRRAFAEFVINLRQFRHTEIVDTTSEYYVSPKSQHTSASMDSVIRHYLR
ncbi:hypothetical protein [Burkholderia cepacia]|uniref:hypothetical protein n=1 Tax=Burkholderia cepacia TaxID=292 RepID=UPI002ABE1A2C|nr:hypothetical protein [Burkholderia cepacia]